MIRRHLSSALVVVLGQALGLLTGGCDADSETELGDQMPEDLPAGNCRDEDADCETDGTDAGSGSGSSSGSGSGTTGGSETGSREVEDACQASTDCDAQARCAAEVDPETAVRSGYECRFACVPTYDDASWCADDTACCESGATCSPRGYCLPADPG